MAHRFVIDTDMGVDDALAVTWLALQQHRELELLAISSVWGNTAVQNAARNVAALLHQLGRNDVPVAVGAAAPVAVEPSRVGALAHGLDGMWGAAATFDAPRAVTDIETFYRSIRAEGATLLALGPLTNLAAVVRADPGTLRRFERIIVLGGAKHHGSMTPVSETNFWHDPHAADIVLSADLPITLVTRDAHRSFALSLEDIAALERAEHPVARYLYRPVARYADVTRRFGEALNFPDIVAAAVALDPDVATDVRSALVRVVSGPGELTRGQSIIALSPNERLPMIEDGRALRGLIAMALDVPGYDVLDAARAVLAREPDNARVVLGVDAERVRASFMRTMTRGGD